MNTEYKRGIKFVLLCTVVQCTVYSCTVYSVQCTVYSVQCTAQIPDRPNLRYIMTLRFKEIVFDN